MQRHGVKVLCILFLLIIFVMVTKRYASAIYEKVAVSVPPHYSVKAAGNNLYIQTNMTVYINNQRATSK